MKNTALEAHLIKYKNPNHYTLFLTSKRTLVYLSKNGIKVNDRQAGTNH